MFCSEACGHGSFDLGIGFASNRSTSTLLWLSPIVKFRQYYIFVFDIGYSSSDIGRFIISYTVHFLLWTISVWSIPCSVLVENCIGRGVSYFFTH